MKLDLYPFKCDSLLKEKLWGGNQLRDFLGKTTSSKMYGESWEVASLPEGTSSIANGKYKGKSLGEMISVFAKAILGAPIVDRFGPEMPLLIKFIDASKKLSVQLHPDDEFAKQYHQESRGKTEMWYVLKAKENASIIAGFNSKMNNDMFNEALSNNSLEEKLNYIPVKEGDAFFIGAGLIHAIGEGIVLAEIQQTSDLTYRVYDYNRKQEDGSYRELHIDSARKAIKYTSTKDVFLNYNLDKKGKQVLKHNSFFKTDIVNLEDITHTVIRENSFTVLIAVDGEGFIYSDNQKYTISKGDTYLIPAQCSDVLVKSKKLKFLEVYM